MLLRQPDLPGPLLPAGGRIAVIAPSGVVQPDRLGRGLDVLHAWGYRPMVGRHVLKVAGHVAGTLAERRQDLHWAMTDPQVDAIWFARGGFGSMHLLEDLIRITRSPQAVPNRPLLGFSDATAFLAALYREHHLTEDPRNPVRQGLLGIHAPVITALGEPAAEGARDRVRAMLQEGRGFSAGVEHVAGPRRSVRGPFVGGNLAMLAALAGTPHALRSHDAIMVLEDVGEPVYRLDRMVTQLQLSGGMMGVQAFVLGSFSAMPGERDQHAESFMEHRLEEFGVPVAAGAPIGHDPDNEPWVYGQVGELDLTGELAPLDLPHAEDLEAAEPPR
ncbi:MAG: LD-carboxypeptidase [Candidatus Nanopelagicales bacterium]|jgi:muramoyltetrapeptide carboxypeptidase|nr:LD-carboxypeptidase [Candidatus Nanopelagicales bacterium]